MFPDVFPVGSMSSLDSMGEHSNPMHYMHGWESQTMSTSVFEAAPIKDGEF